MDPTYEFKFKFTNREQFYGIVRLLNNECGKGNWTIKGKVLKGLKRIELHSSAYFLPSSVQFVEKTVVGSFSASRFGEECSQNAESERRGILRKELWRHGRR